MPNIYETVRCSFRTYQNMPRAEKLPQSLIGYEPNPELAKFLMEALVYNLNAPFMKFTVWTDSPDPQTQLTRTLDFSEIRNELRLLVEAWKASGPNLKVFLAKHPELQSRLLTLRAHLVPTHIGRGHLVCDYLPAEFNPRSQKDLALMQFMPLITNSLYESLGGPCARCGRYYLKNTKRQKVYCSRNCATEATSISSNRERRMFAHKAAIKKAQEKIDEWQKQASQVYWKKWVSSELRLSSHWLTRAVNKGQLKPPVESLDGTA